MKAGDNEDLAEPSFRVLKYSDFRRMPWKNGGGETIEIAISPDGATLDDFNWRISMARVEVDGQFSIFHGIDRTLAILQGGGMSLAISPHPAVETTIAADPLAFDAGAVTQARLLGDPVTDLNLMTRRGRFTHRMTRIALTEPTSIAVSARESFLIAWESGVTIETETGVTLLDPRDALHARDAISIWRLASEGPCQVYLLEIFSPAKA